ncbi:tRNA-queuosine alpha-mannosyltransferase isoform X1 [Hydra vulgaris]|uniref:tRNA-queuosine alpha-mannosyltransferase isoform X1 n=1 Tax=Hydra vulgaris TaxID=6087 RepID=UPI001F5F0E35|nr:glycosyltransferase-like domain-containing protein 1 isoform X1 [Hydra vulgaris]XP_047136356.1 glycosyltransferase-like domain-containing protein 1 isoform X1 [Hydra vulgaris]XP_047136357.1 glycosyltransferase-like domain-containing protein 1 isoform X1 [Hydra vulgaris]
MHHVLLLEPFYGGSHKQLIDYLVEILHAKDIEVTKITMTDKKWHWRLRTSALYFAEHIPKERVFSCIFVSSVINLAELIGLRPDLIKAFKILYFHENQLIYPVRKQQDRDFQYGYNQIVSTLSADVILFNSLYNMESFLVNLNSFLKLMPDYRPKFLPEKIKPKCAVLYFPLKLSLLPVNCKPSSGALHITWPHRWEHDKNPQEFFQVLFDLIDCGLNFKVSVLGQCYSEVPDCFNEAYIKLSNHIANWGFQKSKESYMEILRETDVVISTASHEFFGVSMLEAVSVGCYPLCPNRLVYPEFFPECYLYNTKQQLFKKLKQFCKRPDLVRNHQSKVNLLQFDSNRLRDEYLCYLLKENN